MIVVVSYDVKTSAPGGATRLRAVAQACKDFGQRVQFSVFECSVADIHWVTLRKRILDAVDLEQDSVRFYFLGEAAEKRIEQHGAKVSIDLDGPLIA